MSSHGVAANATSAGRNERMRARRHAPKAEEPREAEGERGIRNEKPRSSPGSLDRAKVGIRVIARLRAICPFSNTQTVTFRYRDISANWRRSFTAAGWPTAKDGGILLG